VGGAAHHRERGQQGPSLAVRRYPVERRGKAEGHGSDQGRIEVGGFRAVGSAHRARHDLVEREQDRRGEGKDGGRAKQVALRLQHEDHAEEAHENGGPAPRPDPFAEHGDRQGGNHQRAHAHQNVGVGQRQVAEAENEHHLIRHQDARAQDLVPGTPHREPRRHVSGPGKRNNEEEKKGVANEHDLADRVVHDQQLAEAVHGREAEGAEEHDGDATRLRLCAARGFGLAGVVRHIALSLGSHRHRGRSGGSRGPVAHPTGLGSLGSIGSACQCLPAVS
jgi:hypothetical protein